MYGFPATDGIALPAPVWLFKLLHVLLLALHFVAMQYLLGSLLVAAHWEFWGRRAGDAERCAAARGILRSLPTVMTFVINLGVPPLLFAQVLYGTALYTSSTLIGLFWISVIGALLVMYALIYHGWFRAAAGRPWALRLVPALLLGIYIAAVYSMNMTLMLHPRAWPGLYRESAAGVNWLFGPAIALRWLFMLAGVLVYGGLGLMMLGASARRPAARRRLLLRDGGAMAAVGAVAQLPLAMMVLGTLSASVQAALGASPIYRGAALLWTALWAVVVLASLATVAIAPKAVAAGRGLPALALGAPALGVLLSLAMATVRDGIRDLSLRDAGFDVWAFEVAPNLGVLAIFLVLVVVALAVVGVLVGVAVKAAPAEEAADS